MSSTTPRTPVRRTALTAAVAGAAITAIAFGGVLGIGALFTSQTSITGQSVETGTLEIQAGTAATSAPISAQGMLPGDEITTEIVLENTGTADAFYAVRVPVASDSTSVALHEALEITVITEDGIEQRSLHAWQTGAMQIGVPLDSGDQVPLVVSVRLPIESDDALQGLLAEFTVQIDAIQARNVPTPAPGFTLD